MNIEDIKQQLKTIDRRFPEAAVRAAVEQREAISPILLDCLRSAVDDPRKVADNHDAMLHIYALYLLAQFRERAAYPMIVKLFSAPGDLCFDLAGDLVTEDLYRVLGAVCGDDLDPIKRMIEDREVNEYVRSACMRTLVALVDWGELERGPVVEYFRSLFNGKLERDADFLWGALVSVCCDLYPEELLPEIERAFADDLVDTCFIRMDSVERALVEDKDQTTRSAKDKGPIKDTVVEMRSWAYIKEPRKVANPAPPFVQRTPVNVVKAGRNDPCPCGSGKKYKKCCLH